MGVVLVKEFLHLSPVKLTDHSSGRQRPLQNSCTVGVQRQADRGQIHMMGPLFTPSLDLVGTVLDRGYG